MNSSIEINIELFICHFRISGQPFFFRISSHRIVLYRIALHRIALQDTAPVVRSNQCCIGAQRNDVCEKNEEFDQMHRYFEINIRISWHVFVCVCVCVCVRIAIDLMINYHSTQNHQTFIR